MAKNYYDITLALAGICQSARLVQQLAHQGHCDADALHVSLNSIIDMNQLNAGGFWRQRSQPARRAGNLARRAQCQQSPGLKR